MAGQDGAAGSGPSNTVRSSVLRAKGLLTRAMYLLLPLVLLALCWVALIRPQQQRVRRQRTMLRTIEPGDEVVLAGGLVGTVRELGDARAQVEVAPGVVVTVLVPAIQSLAHDAVAPTAGSQTPEAPRLGAHRDEDES